MRATLTAVVPVLGRPTNSSMSLGLLPPASMTMGASISLGMRRPRGPTVPQAAASVAEAEDGPAQIEDGGTVSAPPRDETRRTPPTRRRAWGSAGAGARA